MARLPRPDYEHTYHHVVVRGVDGLPIYNTRKKKEKYIKHRSSLAYGTQKYGHMYLSEIGEKLGVTSSGVSRMIKRFQKGEPELKQQWDEALGG